MKLTKKLFMSIMTLALVVVTLSASTFAWFTLGNEAKMENVQVNVTTGTGMEISKDGQTWRNKIELDNPSTLNFTAVTSFDGINFYDTLDGALTGANAAANKKYYEAEFYVRVTKDTNEQAGFAGISLIQVEGTKQVFGTEQNANANKWLADVNLGTTTQNDQNQDVFTATDYVSDRDTNDTIEFGQYRSFDALNAVKVSFTPSTANATAKVYAYEDTDTSWGTVPAILDNGENAEHRYSINSGLAYDYAYAKDYDMISAQPYSCGEASAFPKYITDADITAANALTITSESTEVQQNTKAKTYILVKTDFLSAANASADNAILDGETLDDHYVYAKVTIRIWLEGWDADCINAILAQRTVLSFKLKAN